jgi:hypothetical protein
MVRGMTTEEQLKADAVTGERLARSGERNRAHRARLQRRGAKIAPNMCFSETNPPFFDGIFIVSDYENVHCARN